MEAKVKSFRNLAGFRTAVLTGVFNGKTIEIGLSDSNTTMLTYGKGIKAVGDKVDIPDEDIAVSDAGRYYVSRISADKFLAAAKMRQAMIISIKADKELADLN